MLGCLHCTRVALLRCLQWGKCLYCFQIISCMIFVPVTIIKFDTPAQYASTAMPMSNVAWI